MIELARSLLRRCWGAIVAFRARRQPPPPLPPVVMPPPAPEPPPIEEEVETVPIASNRAERRRLERLRRRHDKFVEPKGVVPAKPRPVRAEAPRPRRKKVEVVVADDKNNNMPLIADTHHERQDDEEVLYEEEELYGEFNFRDTVLQQLESYFVYLKRMRRKDPDAYGFYRQVGATLLPYMATGSWNVNRRDHKDDYDRNSFTELPLWFHKQRPAFGCYAYGADPEVEKFEKSGDRGKDYRMVPKFLYFRKHEKAPPAVQQMRGGDTYVLTVWWDRLDKFKHGAPEEIPIFVSADGKRIVALRSLTTQMVNVYSKRRHSWFRVPQRRWCIPDEYKKWAKDHDDTVQHYLTELFKYSIQKHELAQYSMLRIAVTRGDMVATFSVNPRRMAYFFQDRDVHLNENGARKRVFHIVRAHVRKDGAAVPFHFRGEREFDWAGYHVRITVPGRDHLLTNDIDVGAVDEHWQDRKKKYLTMPQVGTKIAGWINEEAKGA